MHPKGLYKSTEPVDHICNQSRDVIKGLLSARVYIYTKYICFWLISSSTFKNKFKGFLTVRGTWATLTWATIDIIKSALLSHIQHIWTMSYNTSCIKNPSYCYVYHWAFVTGRFDSYITYWALQLSRRWSDLNKFYKDIWMVHLNKTLNPLR